jgi:hypothetical protein
MALVANALISLMARGALFLKVTPCSCPELNQHPNTHHSWLGSIQRISRTRLCRWMVYSRATTSAMAERWGFLVDDILAAILPSAGSFFSRGWSRESVGKSRRMDDRFNPGTEKNVYVLWRRLDLVHSGSRLNGGREGVVGNCTLAGLFNTLPSSQQFCLVFPRFLRKCGPGLAKPRLTARKRYGGVVWAGVKWLVRVNVWLDVPWRG